MLINRKSQPKVCKQNKVNRFNSLKKPQSERYDNENYTKKYKQLIDIDLKDFYCQ